MLRKSKISSAIWFGLNVEINSKIHDVPITVKSFKFMMKLQFSHSIKDFKWIFVYYNTLESIKKLFFYTNIAFVAINFFRFVEVFDSSEIACIRWSSFFTRPQWIAVTMNSPQFTKTWRPAGNKKVNTCILQLFLS